MISLLVIIAVVLILLALVWVAVDQTPVPSPFNWIIKLLAVIVAIIVIAGKSGLA
jgi:hypothetical protein